MGVSLKRIGKQLNVLPGRNNMIDFITGYERLRRQQFREARNANDVAAVLYPNVAKFYTAFVECEASITDFPDLVLMDLTDDFWAETLGHIGNDTNPIAFVLEENQFRRYDPESGIFQPI